jgi:hypothetical protein
VTGNKTSLTTVELALEIIGLLNDEFQIEGSKTRPFQCYMDDLRKRMEGLGVQRRSRCGLRRA